MKRTKILIVVAAAVAVLSLSAFASGKKNNKDPKSTTKVVYTGDIAKKVFGYNGPTPLSIHIKNGKIERIEALPNNETPAYFKRAASKIFPLYEGKSIEQAKNLKVDAVTGATYSSEAIIKNIKLGLEQITTSNPKNGANKAKRK